MTKYAEFQSLTDEQLVHRELQIERDLIALRFLLKTQQLDDTSKLRKLRKDIARIRTVQSSREKEQGLTRDTLRNRYRATFQHAASGSARPASSAGFLQGMASRLGLGGDQKPGGEGGEGSSE